MTIKMILFALGAAALFVAGTWYFGGREQPKKSGSRKSLYDYSFTSIEGAVTPLAKFKGKHLLLVNVASQCGFTPQYAELEKLYETYRDKLVVIGFPANDFMGQEPGTDEEIKTFCSVRYGVTFPLSRKISVTGDGMSDIYRWLSDEKLNGWNDKAPKWNFYKYLITPEGELAGVFPSTTKPMSKEVTDALR